MFRHEAILSTHTTVAVVSDNEPEALDNNGNSVTLDESLIAAELQRLQAEYDSNQYQRDRATAYPSLADQADMQYWDAVNGTTTWQDAIAKVKADYPKG